MTPLRKPHDFGQSPWLDTLSRKRVAGVFVRRIDARLAPLEPPGSKPTD